MKFTDFVTLREQVDENISGYELRNLIAEKSSSHGENSIITYIKGIRAYVRATSKVPRLLDHFYSFKFQQELACANLKHGIQRDHSDDTEHRRKMIDAIEERRDGKTQAFQEKTNSAIRELEGEIPDGYLQRKYMVKKEFYEAEIKFQYAKDQFAADLITQHRLELEKKDFEERQQKAKEKEEKAKEAEAEHNAKNGFDKQVEALNILNQEFGKIASPSAKEKYNFHLSQKVLLNMIIKLGNDENKNIKKYSEQIAKIEKLLPDLKIKFEFEDKIARVESDIKIAKDELEELIAEYKKVKGTAKEDEALEDVKAQKEIIAEQEKALSSLKKKQAEALNKK